MNSTTRRILYWLPRILSVLFTCFIGMFALDAFSEGGGFWTMLLGFGVHLIPMFVLALLTVISWKREWIAVVVYTVLAAAYWTNFSAKPLWVLTIAGPMILLAALYLVGWLFRRNLRPAGA
ncbi:MAG TPA: hypothetical protein VMW43_03095 [Bacteroidota bacterium]|nr:hypothetical protein [Bacteroidota bacterium]